MKYHIWTAGCQMNVADSQRVASALERLGYIASADIEQADVIVLNTCVVRQSAEDKAYGRLQSLKPLKARNPDLVINLMGCLVGVKDNPKLRKVFPHVDVFSPPSDPSPLIEHLLLKDAHDVDSHCHLDFESFDEDRAETNRRHAIMDGELQLPLAQRGKTVSAFIPVVYGCSHACSFCVIPYRRGVERSRPLAEVVAELSALTAQGVREVTLLGQIVDRYGKDLDSGETLSSLLRAVHAVEDIQRVRFLTSHPNWMNAELLDTVAELPKVCEHIEVPVQAGDDDVLRQMKRGYSVDDYRRLIERIRKRVPDASIATDIIVGFPGETEAQFQCTYDLLEELRLDVAHLARYSPRPDTVSARRMPDDVPEEEKMRRFRALETLQAEIAAEINAGYQDQTVEVLVEENHRGRWKGRTRTNKLVFFDSDDELLGKLVPVRVEWTGPWSLIASPIVTEKIPADTLSPH